MATTKKITKEKKTVHSAWMFVALLMTGFLLGTLSYLFSPLAEGFLKTDLSSEKLAPVFEYQGKSYVAFPYPPVGLVIVSSKDCKGIICDLNSAFEEMKRTITPAIIVSVVDKDSDWGKELIEKYKITNLPVFLFDRNLEFVPQFLKIGSFFELRDDKYVMKTQSGESLTEKSIEDNQKSEENPQEENKSVNLETSPESQDDDAALRSLNQSDAN